MSSLPLHRIRFTDQSPSTIATVAFPPLPLPAPTDPRAPAAKQQATTGNEEFGALVLARENGEVEVWEYVTPEMGYGNWVMRRALPPTLTHPSISQMALVIRDPVSFASKPYTVPRISDLRLFTAGSDSGDLVERCLSSGRIINNYSIPSPPLWSIAVAPTQDLLCLATTSPNLHFLSIPSPSIFDPNPALAPPPSHLLRSDALPSRTRTVSIAFSPPAIHHVQGEEYEWRNTGLVTGNSDSSWRRWELPAPFAGGGALQRVMLKGRAVVEKVQKAGRGGVKKTAGSGKATIVWGVGVLPDGTVTTSDSLGNVSFWDPMSLSQRQSFRAHKADAMVLSIGPLGKTIFSSGPDQRICQFVFSPREGKVGGGEWVMASGKRVHSHDVKTLAVFPPYLPLPAGHPHGQKGLNPGVGAVLASAGLDSSLSLISAAAPSSTPLRSPLNKLKSKAAPIAFEDSHPRRYGYLSGGPSGGRVETSREGRMVVVRRERGVGIWRVQTDEQGWEKLLEMELRLRTNLISSSISDSSKHLALSDLYETKLFSLSTTSSNNIKPKRISILPSLLASSLLSHLDLGKRGCGSSKMIFTPDGQRVVLGLVGSGEVVVLDLPQGEEVAVEVVACFKRGEKVIAGRVVKALPNGHSESHDVDDSMNGDGHAENGDVSEEEEDDEDEEDEQKSVENPEWVSSLAVSADGQWLAVADLGGKISIFNLDTLQLHATLPTLPSPPTSLTFPPSTSSPLLSILSPQNNVSFYHLEQRRLLPPSPDLDKFNSALSSLQTPAHGITWRSGAAVASGEGRGILWGSDYLVTVRLDFEGLVKKRRDSTASIGGTPAEGKASRKKRAREANAARLSTSSTSSPLATAAAAPQESFYKIITDRYKSVLGVGWLGVGSDAEREGDEVAVVERPWGDWVGELPPAFSVTAYGRS